MTVTAVAREERCQVKILVPGAWHVCDRPVKAEGLCGLHLEAKRFREKKAG